MGNQINVPNCGVIFLQVFLAKFFINEGLIVDYSFKDRDSQIKAIQLLNFLSTSEDHFAIQSDLLIFKILVDIPIQQQTIFTEHLTALEKAECELLLQAFIDQWQVVRNLSIKGIQEAFIQRSGLVLLTENMIEIHLEQKIADLLLSSIPYNYAMVKLPWLKKILSVKI